MPQGFVCVLRQLDIWFEPNPVGALRSDYTWSLMLNGANVNYNENIPFGVGVDGEKVFLLANEFNRVGVRFGSTPASDLDNIVGFVRFYGTFQLKTEVPLPFEIANPSGRLRPALAKPGVPPVRELPREPTAQKSPIVTPSIPIKPAAPVQPQVMPAPVMTQKQILKPPFQVRLSRNLVKGVQTWVPVKPKGGGFVLLTPQEQSMYAEFIATLKP